MWRNEKEGERGISEKNNNNIKRYSTNAISYSDSIKLKVRGPKY